MKRYFAVSDVHSFVDQMLLALDRAGFDKENSEHYVIICGDAFDRGNYSDGMFRWMKDMSEKGRLIYIRGNHEDLLEDCVRDIRKMREIGQHHISNGTVKTIASIVGCSEYDILCRTFEWSVFDAKIDELLAFINVHSIDYYQLEKTIFVHGWVPTTYTPENTLTVHTNWRDGDWRQARWYNGQEMFYFDIVPPDVTTVVCGHWHTSWGWKKFKNLGVEWGPGACFATLVHYKEETKSRIVALDSCTAYTKKVNCVVFDEDGIVLDSNYSL